jgi:hypothetical protein
MAAVPAAVVGTIATVTRLSLGEAAATTITTTAAVAARPETAAAAARRRVQGADAAGVGAGPPGAAHGGNSAVGKPSYMLAIDGG